MNRTIVIGDLQGMYNEAVALLGKCEVTPDDRVIFAGDLLDRGPDNDKCVDLAMRREIIQGSPACIMGNHESKHLEYYAKDERGVDSNVGIESHIKTRAQLRPHHYEWSKKLPLYIRLPEHNAVVVHAGVYPGRTIEQQKPDHLLHIQMVKPFNADGSPSWDERSMWVSKAPKDDLLCRFWTHFWDGPERIIFGHSVFDKPLITDKVCGIDGGACFGRYLHALILPEWKIVSVKADTDFGKGRRGTQNANIKTYLVHGDVSTYS